MQANDKKISKTFSNLYQNLSLVLSLCKVFALEYFDLNQSRTFAVD